MRKQNISRRRSKRKYITIGIAVALGATCLLAVTLFAANHYAARKFREVEERYNLGLHYQSVSLSGPGSLLIKGLSIIPDDPAVSMHAASIIIKADLWKQTFSKEDIKGFEVDQLHIRYDKRVKDSPDGPAAYASLIEQALKKAARLSSFMPQYVTVRDIYFSYRGEEGERTHHIPQFMMAGDRFMAEAPGEWVCKGMYGGLSSSLSLRLSLRLYAGMGTKITLPFAEDYAKATVKFDTLSLDLQTQKDASGIQVLSGKAGVKGLSVRQALLSSDTINIGRVAATYRLLAGDNFLELDSQATSVRYNRLRFNPFIRIEKSDSRKIRIAVDKEDFAANDLFASIPAGLFDNLHGIRVAGSFSYHMLFDLDMARVNDLVFESDVRPRDLRIIRQGKTDLAKMSKPFIHRIYNEGKLVRSFEVGPLNPDFRPISAISRYLPQAIMHGEDFAFYNHRGFYDEAFHKSLVENIRTGSFQRGASTLTMQLVKNVFLNGDKTMARKLEEILIVWLIENNRLTSKARMFEVYMNVIEWGPGVYGITEAARFYFSKDPSALTLGECIFLAYIIPNPRYLNNYFRGMELEYPFYEFFANAVRRLAQRNIISPEDAIRANPNLNFRGAVITHLTK
ncbi:MAG: transglycosylase domain-containing protein [Tannerellaceae bacterium]|jgi:hypothetical protein|nr:transglycosylase domain-containing protein [Tannerellaceae bacterium]